ncbi:MAG: hypothetical protein ABI864_05225 [Chloroflexota bacterium]
MSTERDVARSVGSWLKEDRHEDADRVLDVVLDQVPATPQRRSSWLAWRYPYMNGLPRIAAVAAAAALVVTIGLALFKLAPNVGEPIQSPTPTATPTPAALENPPGTGPVTLAAGTYAVESDFPVRVSFTLPAGWTHVLHSTQHVALSQDAESLGLTFMTVLNVYMNPCQEPNRLADPPVGASVDDLVTSLIHLPRTDSGTVSDVSIDGFQGKSFDLHVQRAGCSNYAQNLWKASWEFEGDGFAASSREQLRVYVLDVQGQRIVIVTSYVDGDLNASYPDGGPNAAAYKAELQTIVESIHFE